MKTIAQTTAELIQTMGAGGSTDFPECLARLFEADDIQEIATIPPPVDPNASKSQAAIRLTTILSASEGASPGTHFDGILDGWADSGFRSEFREGGNQSGHFLTAVHLAFAPTVLRRIHALLMILPDLKLFHENILEGPDRRLEIGYEFVADDAIFHPLRAAAATNLVYIETFESAISVMRPLMPAVPVQHPDIEAARMVLLRFPSDKENRGDGQANILLAAVGFYFGRAIAAGEITSRAIAGELIRHNLAEAGR